MKIKGIQEKLTDNLKNLINDLLDDEQKHEQPHSALDKIKSGMYPYAS